MSTVMPRSALRHRPIASTQTPIPEWVIATPRRSNRHRPRPAQTAMAQAVQTHHRSPVAILAAGMLLMVMFIWIVQVLWPWMGTELDAIRYGYPRTTQVSHAVGHGGISRFLATNQDGQIYVLEISGAGAAAHLLVGPHVLGAGADLAPVTLDFVGRTDRPDLLIEVQGVATRFHNTGSTYVLV